MELSFGPMLLLSVKAAPHSLYGPSLNLYAIVTFRIGGGPVFICTSVRSPEYSKKKPTVAIRQTRRTITRSRRITSDMVSQSAPATITELSICMEKNLSPWLRDKKTASAKLNKWRYSALFGTVIIALNLDLSFELTSHEKGNRRSSWQKSQFLVFPQTVKHTSWKDHYRLHTGECVNALYKKTIFTRTTYTNNLIMRTISHDEVYLFSWRQLISVGDKFLIITCTHSLSK